MNAVVLGSGATRVMVRATVVEAAERAGPP
jgi:hypothetical protein